MKKTCSLVVAFILAFFCVTTAQASDISQQESAIDFLDMLGILDASEVNADNAVSRAAFTDMLVKAMNCDATSAKDGIFSDVNTTVKYAAAITKASEIGLISNSSDGMFRPDDSITMDAALKMSVLALGYNSIAEAYGGYPTGHRIVANDLDLLKGVGNQDELKVSDAAVLLFNFLTADVCKVTAVKGENLTQIRDYGNSPLKKYFTLEKMEGIIKTAGYATMIPGRECRYSAISIDGYNFNTDIEDAQKYLGKSAVVWFNEESNTVKAIYVKPVNKTIVIDASELAGIRDNSVITYNKLSGKDSKYPLSPSFTFVKNGRNKVQTDSDFTFDSGELILMDNNGDGYYDVAYAHVADYMVVSYVNSSTGIVYDSSQNGKQITMDNKNGNYASIKIENKDGSIAEADIDDLKADMVLKVYVSEDGNYVEAIASSATVNGIVAEIGEDTVLIDNNEYKINSYFGDIGQIIPGSLCSFLLAVDGSITAFSPGQSGNMEYGYFLDYFSKDSGFSDKVQISLMTTGGKIIRPYLSDKLIFDGARISKTDEVINNKLMNGQIPNYQVIRYSLNDEGEVSKIDTAVAVSESQYSTRDPEDMPYGEDTLKCFLNKKTAFYYSMYNVFTPFTVVGGKTIMFSVPLALSNGATERIDDEYFSILSRDFKSYGATMIDAYDMDKYLQPAIIVVYNENSGSNIKVQESATPAIVESVSSGLNSDGEKTKIITYYQDNRFYKMPLSIDLFTKTTDDKLPASGDVIRVASNGREIVAFATDVKYNAVNKSFSFTADTLKDGQVDDSYYTGTSYVHSGTSLTLKLGEAAGFNSSHSDTLVGKYTGFTFSGGCKFSVYETKTGTVRPGKTDMLVDGISAGADNASKVVVKCYSHGIQQLFIYE